MTNRQRTINNLANALTWIRERNIIATRANVKSVANRFDVDWKILAEALQLEAKEGAKILARIQRSKKPNTKPCD